MLKISTSILMNNLANKIEHMFSSLPSGNALYLIDEAQPELGYVYKYDSYFGVAVKNDLKTEVYEEFNAVRFRSDSLVEVNKDEMPEHYLMLECNNFDFIHEFSLIGAEFSETNREKLLHNPLNWWDSWSEMLGDIKSSALASDVFAELLAYAYFVREGNNVTWKPSDYLSQDLEMDDFNLEVKSTMMKYQSRITVSSQFQVDNLDNKDVKLLFVRLEKSESGHSINDIVKSLPDDHAKFVSNELALIGYNLISKKSNQKFRVLEIRLYNIDNLFPKITLDSFVDRHLPVGITGITYEVDLDGLSYERINESNID